MDHITLCIILSITWSLSLSFYAFHMMLAFFSSLLVDICNNFLLLLFIASNLLSLCNSVILVIWSNYFYNYRLIFIMHNFEQKYNIQSNLELHLIQYLAIIEAIYLWLAVVPVYLPFEADVLCSQPSNFGIWDTKWLRTASRTFELHSYRQYILNVLTHTPK